MSSYIGSTYYRIATFKVLLFLFLIISEKFVYQIFKNQFLLRRNIALLSRLISNYTLIIVTNDLMEEVQSAMITRNDIMSRNYCKLLHQCVDDVRDDVREIVENLHT